MDDCEFWNWFYICLTVLDYLHLIFQSWEVKKEFYV